MKSGYDYIGVGVGAMIFNENGEIFLAQRGPEARNEQGTWEFPGGGVDFGETLTQAIIREMYEEYAIHIHIEKVLGVFDHILPEEQQHWVSITYIVIHSSGSPKIMEPHKCSKIGWFPLSKLPKPLSKITEDNLSTYFAAIVSTD